MLGFFFECWGLSVPRLGLADIQWDEKKCDLWLDRWEISKCFLREKTDSENRHEVSLKGSLKAHKALVCTAKWRSWRSASTGTEIAEPFTKFTNFLPPWYKLGDVLRRKTSAPLKTVAMKTLFFTCNTRTWTPKPLCCVLKICIWFFFFFLFYVCM